MKKLLFITLTAFIDLNCADRAFLAKQIAKQVTKTIIQPAQQENFTPTYWNQFDKTPKTHVPMYRMGRGVGQISSMPGETSAKTIWTNALSGCTALALFAQCTSGARHVALSHHAPIDREEQISQLKNSWSKFQLACGGANQVEQTELIAMFQQGWIKPQNSKYYVEAIHEEDQAYAQRLAQIIGTTPQIILYSGENGDELQVTLAPGRTTYSSSVDRHKLHEIEPA